MVGPTIALHNGRKFSRFSSQPRTCGTKLGSSRLPSSFKGHLRRLRKSIASQPVSPGGRRDHAGSRSAARARQQVDRRFVAGVRKAGSPQASIHEGGAPRRVESGLKKDFKEQLCEFRAEARFFNGYRPHKVAPSSLTYQWHARLTRAPIRFLHQEAARRPTSQAGAFPRFRTHLLRRRKVVSTSMSHSTSARRRQRGPRLQAHPPGSRLAAAVAITSHSHIESRWR